MRRRAAGAVAGAVLLGVVVTPARALEPAPCQLGGPAGTASVVAVDLPHGSPSLALRVTTPSPTVPAGTGGTASWHLATQVAVIRATDGALMAYRAVQLGSSPRAVVVSSGPVDARPAAPSVPAPFRHVGAATLPYLPAGRYLVVAYGVDGSALVPNPGWSAETSFGAPVECVPLRVATTLLDRDQSQLAGGTQVGAYGAGYGAGGSTSWTTTRRYVVGLLDAGTQVAGDASAVGRLPGGRQVSATDALRGFSGARGGYRFTASWAGAFPLVLVCAVAFDR